MYFAFLLTNVILAGTIMCFRNRSTAVMSGWPRLLVGKFSPECGSSRFHRNVNTLQLVCIAFTFQKTAYSPPRDPQELQVEVTVPEASERTTGGE